MISDSPRNRDLPFWPTLVCLWAAGWVTSAVTALLFVGHAYPTGSSPAAMLAVNLLLSSAIGAVVVKQLLLSVVECEIAYSAVLVALVAGSTASTVVGLVALSQSTAGLGLSFLPAAAGAFVSYWLLQNAARSEPARTGGATVHAEPVADPMERGASGYAEAVAAARESALGLVAAVSRAAPEAVPAVINEGMFGLEAARRRLEQARLPGTVSSELNHRLVRGLRQLADDLVGISQEAATTGNRYVSLDLDQSEGLRAVRQALDDLEALGFATSDW